MRTIKASPENVRYYEPKDVLFVWLTDGPEYYDHEDELDNGVFLSYDWKTLEPAYMEVWDFSKNYGSLPTTISAGDLRIEVPKEMVAA